MLSCLDWIQGKFYRSVLWIQDSAVFFGILVQTVPEAVRKVWLNTSCLYHCSLNRCAFLFVSYPLSSTPHVQKTRGRFGSVYNRYPSCQSPKSWKLFFNPPSLKRKAYEITFLPARLSVPPLINLNQLADFYGIQNRGHAVEGDPDAIPFNLIALTILKWRMFKLLRCMPNLRQSTWDHKMLYADGPSKDE
jgi:hypothetical protein